jgi:2-haloacid dehalogenase
MSEIRHIVFDLGRVLLRWEPELPYRRLIPDDDARRRFMNEVCNAAWLRKTDLGGSWGEAERRQIERFPNEAEMIQAFRRSWHEMVPDTVADTPEILAALLAAEYDVTALTNFAEDTYEEAL